MTQKKDRADPSALPGIDLFWKIRTPVEVYVNMGLDLGF